MRTPVFRPAAAADIEQAFVWYEEARPGLGEEFLAEVFVGVQAVLDRPESFPIVHRHTRRALVRRFPYALFFRLLADRVVFLACFHVRRKPTAWQHRR